MSDEEPALNAAIPDSTRSRVLDSLREATGPIHARLEGRLDIVDRLAEPRQRTLMVQRYAALHVPAERALEPHLATVPQLEFDRRRRAPMLASYAGGDALPWFPEPSSRSEALGMFYVLEGSTLGGRVILRRLEERGVSTAGLDFLNPYGRHTAARWKSLLDVLSRDLAGDDALTEACDGAVSAFEHAERVLCGAGP